MVTQFFTLTRATFHHKHAQPTRQQEKRDTTRLFKRYAFLARDKNAKSPWEMKTPSQLNGILLKWRFKREDDYDNTWEKPLPPWITRDIIAKQAEEERENAERQLMLIEDLAMTELLERKNNKMLQVHRFCGKVAAWLVNKAERAMWPHVDEHLSEEMERKLMGVSDVASRVIERAYRKELELAKRRFLSQKRLEYKRWVKKEKTAIKMVEKVRDEGCEWRREELTA